MNFSPYQPPPDAQRESSALNPSGTTTSKGKSKLSTKSKRPWFSRDASSFQGAGSYQSGSTSADPSSYNQAYAYDPESLENPAFSSQSGGAGNPASGSGGNPQNAWESRLGWRVDVLAAVAYLGGPITALILLILETTNDYVRFHAYQSALLSTPLFLLWLLMTLIGFWRWLRRVVLFASLAIAVYSAFRAFKDPTTVSAGAGVGINQTGYLPRFYLPIIGDLAEKWVGDE